MSKIFKKAEATSKAARALRELTLAFQEIGWEEFSGPVIEPILELADAIESMARRYMEKMDRGNLRLLQDLGALEMPRVLH